MNTIRPLLFLTYRSVFNGLKRALTTPRRLISVIVIFGYYFAFFIRPALVGRGMAGGLPAGSMGRLDFPPLEVIDALTFGVFAFLSIFMLMGVASANTNYRPADVDILFATPISPKVVLLFRMVRDYLMVLFIPVFFTLIGLRPVKMGWQAIFRNMPNPSYASLTLRFMTISWILMALGWVTLNYAVSLYINRSDRNSERNRRILGWAVSGVLIALVAFVSFRIREIDTVSDLLALARSPLLRGFFFMATFSTEFTLSPFSNTMVQNGLIGLAGLLAVPAVGLMLSLKQIDWMYDQAAIRAVKMHSANQWRRSGDLTAMVAQQAREGKKRTMKLDFVKRFRMNGPWALVWKELLLQPRTMLGMTITFTIMGILMNILPIISPKNDDLPIGYVMLAMQGMTVFMVGIATGQTGFIEVLRRVDLQKPLPFRPATIIWYEVASKSLLAFIPGLCAALIVLAMKPFLWPFVIATMIGAPAFSLLICASVFLVTMLFPDVEDPSQRQFRGIITFLTVVITGVFPLGAFIGLSALHAPPYLGALVAAAIASGIAFAITAIAGHLYAGFNPSE